jgi:hypothetical protein
MGFNSAFKGLKSGMLTSCVKHLGHQAAWQERFHCWKTEWMRPVNCTLGWTIPDVEVDYQSPRTYCQACGWFAAMPWCFHEYYTKLKLWYMNRWRYIFRTGKLLTKSVCNKKRFSFSDDQVHQIKALIYDWEEEQYTDLIFSFCIEF